MAAPGWAWPSPSRWSRPTAGSSRWPTRRAPAPGPQCVYRWRNRRPRSRTAWASLPSTSFIGRRIMVRDLGTSRSAGDTPPCAWAWLGRVEYGVALVRQRALQEARATGAIPDTLLLLEHPPVLTLGRRGSRADVLVPEAQLAARGIAVHETNRGGLVTYHGPGQLVAYPIADIRTLTGGDVVRYVWGL